MRILVFTGAGVSRESGLKTFRDGDGLWAGHRVEDVCSATAWKKQPEKVIAFFNDRRREVLAAEPNAAHLAIAELQSDHDVTVVTQNYDDLHERAGSLNVIHVHGLITKKHTEGQPDVFLDCREDIAMGDVDDEGFQYRPHIVFFGENPCHMVTAMKVSKEAEVTLVVGSTLAVYPAANVAENTKARDVWVVDPNPPSRKINTFRSRLRTICQPATLGVPTAIEQIRRLAAIKNLAD